jgi:DNA-binding transcriptional regulator YdaS (Cro superfamily)
LPYDAQNMDEKTHLQCAIDELGGVAAAAAALGLKAATVYEWLTGRRPLPLARALEIERLTDGKIACEVLRPDVNWQRPTHAPIRAASPEKAAA